ncbi:heterokaryon incompatibility protein-domain-containing protein [Xylaria scruposa]|nr:heterokaryon incompatibility protein-domain-containing protein [Xylaria scruposa]
MSNQAWNHSLDNKGDFDEYIAVEKAIGVANWYFEEHRYELSPRKKKDVMKHTNEFYIPWPGNGVDPDIDEALSTIEKERETAYLERDINDDIDPPEEYVDELFFERRRKPPGTRVDNFGRPIYQSPNTDSGFPLVPHVDPTQAGRVELFNKERQKQDDLLADLGLKFLHGQNKSKGKDFYKSMSLNSSYINLRTLVPESDISFKPKPDLWKLIDPVVPRAQADPMGDWPSRLLHVPTMCSMSWAPENVYGGSYKEPRYAVLSYTWGRWELPSNHEPPHPALNVAGIPWKIPPVSEELFTVEEFETTIRKCACEAGADFIWVDVACIDQRSESPQKMREIGRQAKIFRGASQAFVWLLPLPNFPKYNTLSEVSDLESSATHPSQHPLLLEQWLRVLERAYTHLQDIFERWYLEFGASSNHSTGGLEASKSHKPSPATFWHFTRAVNPVLFTLTCMPWFSSIWTLQEAFLQPTSILVDRTGSFAKSHISGNLYTLHDVVTYCKAFYQLPSTSKEFSKLGQISLWELQWVEMIERTGLHHLADRDRLTLYSCSGERNAMDEKDRIYGIMQIWNFQVGAAASAQLLLPTAAEGKGKQDQDVLRQRPRRDWTLEDLELELGKCLLLDLPIESQIQVHEMPVKNRQSWRISRSSATPLDFLKLDEFGHLEGNFCSTRTATKLGLREVNGRTYAYFEGLACEFRAVQRAWTTLSLNNDHDGQVDPDNAIRDAESSGGRKRPFRLRICLDHTAVINYEMLHQGTSLQNVVEGKQLDVAEAISKCFEHLGRSISIFMLGILSQERNEEPTENPDNVAIGLIAMLAPDNIIGGWYKRLGICCWDVPSSSDETSSKAKMEAIKIASGISSTWSQLECILG